MITFFLNTLNYFENINNIFENFSIIKLAFATASPLPKALPPIVIDAIKAVIMSDGMIALTPISKASIVDIAAQT